MMNGGKIDTMEFGGCTVVLPIILMLFLRSLSTEIGVVPVVDIHGSNVVSIGEMIY